MSSYLSGLRVPLPEEFTVVYIIFGKEKDNCQNNSTYNIKKGFVL